MLITQKPHPEWVRISHEALKIRTYAGCDTTLDLMKQNPSFCFLDYFLFQYRFSSCSWRIDWVCGSVVLRINTALYSQTEIQCLLSEFVFWSVQSDKSKPFHMLFVSGYKGRNSVFFKWEECLRDKPEMIGKHSSEKLVTIYFIFAIFPFKTFSQTIILSREEQHEKDHTVLLNSRGRQLVQLFLFKLQKYYKLCIYININEAWRTKMVYHGPQFEASWIGT